jgi:serine protease Do
MTQEKKESTENQNKKEETYGNDTNDFHQSQERTINRSVWGSALVTIIILLVVFGILYGNRMAIFKHLSNEYNATENSGQNAPAPNDQTQVERVVHNKIPSVVSVIVSKEVPIYEKRMQQFNPYGMGGGFQVPQYQQNGTQKQQVAGGSGFVVTKGGLVVTNKHVVADQNASYSVIMNDGKTHNAKVIARDPSIDVAILQIEGGGTYQPLQFGNSDALKLGQSVIAIGNALGEFQNSVSVGVVSGLSRSIVASGGQGGISESLSHVIQTDAAINPGNSGGPLLDLSGKVIGVNVAVAQGTQNIGFSIPANILKASVESVEKTGKIIYPYIGVRYVPINSQVQQAKNLSVDHGALIMSGGKNVPAVVPGSPAEKAGLKENDIILSVDGEQINNQNSLDLIIRKDKIGQTVTLDVLRNGKHVTVKVTLATVPSNLGQ